MSPDPMISIRHSASICSLVIQELAFAVYSQMNGDVWLLLGDIGARVEIRPKAAVRPADTIVVIEKSTTPSIFEKP